MTRQLLAPLTEAERERVLRTARPYTFAKGEVVFREGDPGETLHLVRRGRLAVQVSIPSGDTATLCVLSAGDAYGELALLREGHDRTATVIALEPSETVALTRADFETLRRDHPGVEQLLVEMLGRSVDELSRALIEALYEGVDRRVVRRLVDLADAYQVASAGPIAIPITQDDLAGMAGATRPTVNQVLQRLAAKGMVSLGRGRIDVLDLEELRRRSTR